jgi:hypothetical protein
MNGIAIVNSINTIPNHNCPEKKNICEDGNGAPIINIIPIIMNTGDNKPNIIFLIILKTPYFFCV